MTNIPTHNHERLFVRGRRDDKHVVGVGSERAVLTDDQLAMLGRVAIARAVPDAGRE